MDFSANYAILVQNHVIDAGENKNDTHTHRYSLTLLRDEVHTLEHFAGVLRCRPYFQRRPACSAAAAAAETALTAA